MVRRPILIFGALILMAVALVACLGGIAQPTPIPEEVIYTQAAQTVFAEATVSAGSTAVAQLTQQAIASPTLPPPPTATNTLPPTIPPSPTPVPPTPTLPPTPTNPPPPTPTPMPCDWAQFVKDISIPDGTVFQPGVAFTKTWRLRNIGTCTWTNNYSLVFDSGSLMGGPTTVGLTGNVLAGDLVDLSVNLVAPATDGNYQGNWKLRNAAGQTFGIGPAANQPFWVKITVKRSEQVIYDFTRDFCIANWHTAVTNMLLCPTPSESDTGFVSINPTPKLENNTTEDETALLTYPNQGNGGFITGYYPPMKITSGDHLKTVIGCIYGAVDCNVTFELSYSVSGGRPQTLGSWSEVYDGNFRKIDLDLSFLNGQTVQIVFNVYNNGDSADDQAFWLLPRITR